MRRDFRALAAGPFDLLVLGGGIYGAWTAYDGALRGLRVALVERTDWGAGTSSRSSKLIHGGLRYLEHGQIGVVRKSLAERALLQRLGPHRARDLRFALPVHGGGAWQRLRLRVGLWIYDRLAGGRQPGGPHRHLPAGEMAYRYPFLRREHLQGGFTFGDAVTDDARLVLEIVDGAMTHGAVAVNHAAATRLLEARGRVTGAEVRDAETGEIIQVRATAVASCTGAWSAELSGGPERDRPHLRLTRGVHLVLPALPTPDAFLLPDPRRRRVVFLIPWYGRTLLGTTDTDFTGSPDRVEPDADDLSYLLEMAAAALRQPWRTADIISTFAGLRVLPASQGSPSAVTREFSIHESGSGLLTPVGGKISSARVDAAGLVDRVMARLGRRDRCATGDRPLPWTATDAPPALPGLDDDLAGTLIERHGRHAGRVLEIAGEIPDGSGRLMPGAPFLRGEVIHAVRHEMARSLADILRRRLPLLLIDPPDPDTLEGVARLAAAELGWDRARTEAEIRSLGPATTAVAASRP